ncbi:hypothetical protein TPHA_0E01890 [Tetrapisispora phaffii CBS 4417]|uniref:Phosphatidylglycerophosphatase GEP4, mitochondrial n=1 Tax=Tetrapisispora phaffii (strain ATCC 24235 / CBS 4417 / NBRC 1672 / NRRL Y-8282 / UCD 70-5) TaxID=1071381 RepID=G8BTQ4_TETPH|nr:hypothetical protein TPHA_0E01890 [Tetrapisispora phaffii CBS 4417]CCE63282.1 hypothetical protein TPHA_0E01890 [Tetrapisispora phaffii CBS 4417]
MINYSATLNCFKLFYNPKLCMPNMTVPSFNQIPLPIGSNIKAIVLDKDNCFAYPYKNEVWPEYIDKWNQLKRQYPDKSILIVSNSVGSSDDVGYNEAQLLEKKLGIPVLRHKIKNQDVKMRYWNIFILKIIDNPNQIAIVGDRLFTDVMMANLMGAYSVWVKDGVSISDSPISKFEKRLYDFLK